MRFCKGCLTDRPVKEFSTRGAGRLQYRCRPCFNVYQNEFRRHLKPSEKARRQARWKVTRRERQIKATEMVTRMKQKPCADCGGSFPSVCMDFDHVSGEKFDDVSRMMITGYSLERILDEISKCEVVCSNCHRIRTAVRRELSIDRTSPPNDILAAVLKDVEPRSESYYDAAVDAALVY